MSIKLTTEVYEYGPSDRTETAVLATLADVANDDGYCWPSMETVAHRAQLSRRGAQKVVAHLTADGWLDVETGGGRGGTNVYHVVPPRKATVETANPETRKGERECTKGRTPVRPNLIEPALLHEARPGFTSGVQRHSRTACPSLRPPATAP